jgi:hypothetical protein
MGSMEKMADLCPVCYGPEVPGKKEHEPHFIVCMDGNFQHRRHIQASSEIPEILKTPSLFIDPVEVLEMETYMDQENPSQRENGENVSEPAVLINDHLPD